MNPMNLQERGEPSYEVHSLTASIEAGARPGSFKGMASVFGSVAYGAKGPTQFSLDAFDKTIKESGGKLPLLWQHTDAQPIGVSYVKRGANGLEIEGHVTQNTFGKDVTALLRDGAIDGISIGFDAEDHRYDRHASEGSVRVVTRAKLHEVSLVTFPADRMARVRQVHSAITKLPAPERALAEGLVATIIGAREQHEGRVFSSKNVEKMKEACTVLAELIRTVDPTFMVGGEAEPDADDTNTPPTVSEVMRRAELRYAESLTGARLRGL